MKTDPESMLKKGIKAIAASFPVAASLAQWWSEMDSDIQAEKINGLQVELHSIKNPILYSHPSAKDALKLIYKKIESTEKIHWDFDDELRPFLEVICLWEKQHLLTGQHALERSWISIRLTNPLFIMAVFDAEKGDQATNSLKRSLWNSIKTDGKGTNGTHMAESMGTPLPYVDTLFTIFESEGKGWKSKEIGSSYFAPNPDLC